MSCVARKGLNYVHDISFTPVYVTCHDYTSIVPPPPCPSYCGIYRSHFRIELYRSDITSCFNLKHFLSITYKLEVRNMFLRGCFSMVNSVTNFLWTCISFSSPVVLRFLKNVGRFTYLFILCEIS